VVYKVSNCVVLPLFSAAVADCKSERLLPRGWLKAVLGGRIGCEGPRDKANTIIEEWEMPAGGRLRESRCSRVAGQVMTRVEDEASGWQWQWGICLARMHDKGCCTRSRPDQLSGIIDDRRAREIS
jgi:hypothetical protein